MLSDYAEPLSTGAGEATGSGLSTGTLPPPLPNQVDWRLAIRTALLVALVAAVLGVLGDRVPNLFIFSFVWIISASLTTLALYQRRRPLASMNVRIGAKIGILVGVVLVFALGAVVSAGFFVARFGMHTLAAFDSEITSQMKQQIDQVVAKNPITSEQLSLIYSVQFRTGWMLFCLGVGLFMIFAISVFGGAVAGLLRTRRSATA